MILNGLNRPFSTRQAAPSGGVSARSEAPDESEEAADGLDAPTPGDALGLLSLTQAGTLGALTQSNVSAAQFKNLMRRLANNPGAQ